MIFIRFIVLVFNVVVVTYLIYEMIRIAREPMEKGRKWLIIAGGIILLISPLGMLIRIFPASMQYFLIYPVAVSLYAFMIRRL